MDLSFEGYDVSIDRNGNGASISYFKKGDSKEGGVVGISIWLNRSGEMVLIAPYRSASRRNEHIAKLMLKFIEGSIDWKMFEKNSLFDQSGDDEKRELVTQLAHSMIQFGPKEGKGYMIPADSSALSILRELSVESYKKSNKSNEGIDFRKYAEELLAK